MRVRVSRRTLCADASFVRGLALAVSQSPLPPTLCFFEAAGKEFKRALLRS